MESNRIPTNASSKEIANSLNETKKEIETNGETPKNKEEFLFKYARLKFSEGAIDKSFEIFSQCKAHTSDFGLRENYEIYYWIARILEAQEDLGKAKATYENALKKCNENPDLISREEINSALLNVTNKITENRFTYKSDLGLKIISKGNDKK